MLNQKGMTLVEVVATLLISSLVIILIFTTLSISTNYNISETKKLRLQNEMNYIITDIQNFHRKCESYEISILENKIEIKDCKTKKEILNKIISTDYIYNSTPNILNEVIETRGTDSSYKLKLIITDPGNTKLSVSISTNISRFNEN